MYPDQANPQTDIENRLAVTKRWGKDKMVNDYLVDMELIIWGDKKVVKLERGSCFLVL